MGFPGCIVLRHFSTGGIKGRRYGCGREIDREKDSAHGIHEGASLHSMVLDRFGAQAKVVSQSCLTVEMMDTAGRAEIYEPVSDRRIQ